MVYPAFADIDECTAGTHDCTSNAICNNTDASFTCSCLPGFTGDAEVECKGIEFALIWNQ